ncbi:MAG: SRPBCC family protein [Chloroflexia bacterium]
MATTTLNDITFSVEPGQQGMTMSKVFDAPRDLVFKAHTDPALIPNWWGPRKYKTVVDNLDAKSGGAWRFLNVDSDGNEYAFHGVFHDVSFPTRIIQTFEWEGMPGHVSMDTYLFEEVDGKTRLTCTSVFQSIEDRDGMAQSGAQEGGIETWERLAEVVAAL